jgi:hypothetical protein
MGHLIEAVFGRDWPNPERFEQNVIAGISGHRTAFGQEWDRLIGTARGIGSGRPFWSSPPERNATIISVRRKALQSAAEIRKTGR